MVALINQIKVPTSKYFIKLFVWLMESEYSIFEQFFWFK